MSRLISFPAPAGLVGAVVLVALMMSGCGPGRVRVYDRTLGPGPVAATTSSSPSSAQPVGAAGAVVSDWAVPASRPVLDEPPQVAVPRVTKAPPITPSLVPGSDITGAADAAPGVLTQAAFRALAAQFFPSGQVDNALAVATCESGLEPSSIGPVNADGTHDWGLFQFNDGGTLQGTLVRTGRDPTNLNMALDPRWAMQGAALLWSQRGWEPWTCARELGIWHD